MRVAHDNLQGRLNVRDLGNKMEEGLMLRSDALDYEFMTSMMDSELQGYRLEWTKKLMLPVPMMGGWSLYVVDIEERRCW